ncbi:hypothetical protein LZ496_12960 [Sphingomonas sp. NSE70-1]|uniref:Membrane protein YkvI n=1 Tax=Sphingomonas caseinilyticus TaxID=2908205 RepID=A0ABT0RXC9_9SPHN|nr:hypothetical protein [Sphingomonas caseinilyticus]MCL6699687.1 hypothetical protein [Sphingomonas caseinilyticus]
MDVSQPNGPSRFQRYLLPGFAFKAVVIGGGYATGRELAEFFLPSGAWGGVAAMTLSMMLFSLCCVVTFLFARQFGARDYVTFFKQLLGPGWMLFEGAYILFIVLILAVYGAAAGAIGTAVFGLNEIWGTIALGLSIIGIVTFGNASVERMFAYVSYLLYAVYALFVVLGFSRFGNEIQAAFANGSIGGSWAAGGTVYAGYNLIGAVVILPVMRHLTSNRDAVIAGLLSGPLAMLPGALFFICMVAFLPDIASATLPSDFMLQRLEMPLFHLLFQLMIFSALLESGASSVHAINERIAKAVRIRRGSELSHRARLVIALALLIFCMFLADRFGLVALIATGYRALAYILLAVFVLPLMTFGVWRLWKNQKTSVEAQ